jgi:hypothetical protein
MIGRFMKPYLYMAACLALGALIVGLLPKSGVSHGTAQLAGNIVFVSALGLCVWRDGDFRPAAVFAAALILLASCLGLMFVILLALPGSLPLFSGFANVFELGYVRLDGGIHGPPIEPFVILWLLSMLVLIGVGLLFGGLLRLYRTRPGPQTEGDTA